MSVYVPNDATVEDELALFRKARARGDWEEALRRIDAIRDALGKAQTVPLAASPDGVYRAVPEVLVEEISGWPPEGIEAYRTRYDALARVDLVEARRRRDPALLSPAAEHPFASGSDEAILLGADLAIERGDFEVAIADLRLLIEYHPGPAGGKARLLARLGFAAARAARPEAALWALDEARERGLARERVRSGSFAGPLEDLLAAEVARAESGLETAPPGGVSAPMPGPAAWTDALPASPITPEVERSCLEQGLPVPVPVRVAPGPGGAVAVATPGVVRVFDSATGAIRWRYPEVIRRPEPLGVWEPSLGLVWVGGDLVAVLEGQISAFDGRTGRMRWWLRTAEGGGLDPEVQWMSGPVAAAGRIYVALARSGQAAGLHLAAIEAASGRILYLRFLYQGHRQRYLGYPSPSSDPVLGESEVYVAGGGAAAAIDLSTGRIRWVSACGALPPDVLELLLAERSGWAPGAAIVARGRLVVAAQDSDELVAFDRRTGRVAWRRPREGARHLAGATGSRVVFTGGGRIAAADLWSGRLAWTAPLPLEADSVEARPAFAGGRLWVPSGWGVLAYDAETGEEVGAYRAATGSVMAAEDGGFYLAGARVVSRHPPIPGETGPIEEAKQVLRTGRVAEALRIAPGLAAAGEEGIRLAREIHLEALAAGVPGTPEEIDRVLASGLALGGPGDERVRMRLAAAELHANAGRSERQIGILLDVIEESESVLVPLPDGEYVTAGVVCRATIRDVVEREGEAVLEPVKERLEATFQVARVAGTSLALLELVARHPYHPRAREALAAALELALPGEMLRVAGEVLRLLDSGPSAASAELVARIARCWSDAGRRSAARGVLLAGRDLVPAAEREALEEILASEPLAGVATTLPPAGGDESMHLVWKSSLTAGLGRGSFLEPEGRPPAGWLDLVLFSDRRLFLEARDARTGTLLWRRKIGSPMGCAWAGERLVVYGPARAIALEPGTGRTLWKYDPSTGALEEPGEVDRLDGGRELLHQVGVAGRHCLIAASDGLVHLIDAQAGEICWKTPVAEGLPQFPTLAPDRGEAFVYAERRFHRLDLASGRILGAARWPLRRRPDRIGSRFVGLVEDEAGGVSLGAIDATTFDVLWNRPATRWGTTATVQALGAEDVLISDTRPAGAFVEAVRASDGTTRWSRSLADQPLRLGPLLVDDSIWLAAGTNETFRFHAFDRGDGRERTLPAGGEGNRFDLAFPWRDALVAHEGTRTTLVLLDRGAGATHYLDLRHGVKEIYDVASTLSTLVVSTDRGLFGFAGAELDSARADLAAARVRDDRLARVLACQRLGRYDRALEEFDLALLESPAPAGTAFLSAADRIGGLAELAAQQAPQQFTIPFLDRTPEIDGRLEEDWGRIRAVPFGSFRHLELVSHESQRHDDWAGATDQSALLYLGYDEYFLYLALEVGDDQGIQFDTRSVDWIGDNLLVSFDGTSDGGFAYGSHDMVMWLFNPRPQPALPAPPPGGPGAEKKEREIEGGRSAILWREDEKLRTYEWSIPWSQTGIVRRQPGARFRMNVYVMDDDDARGVTRGIAWAPGNFFDRTKEKKIQRFTPEYFVRITLGPRRGPVVGE